MNLTVDVVSDVICPWCYIGKRRLQKAVAEFNTSVQIHWHPFQLNPTMPRDGISRREYRTRKFGSWERSQELDARVTVVGKQEGIQFAFDCIRRTPNTLDAHRLIWLSDQHDCQDAVVESLFHAYFTEGRDIGDRNTLLDLATDAGLDRANAANALDSNQAMEAVTDEEQRSRRHRVEGVPFFIVNRKFTLAGAQPPEILLELFRRASQKDDAS